VDIADTRTAVVEAVASAVEAAASAGVAAAFVVDSHKELAPDSPNSRCPFALQLRNLSPFAMVARAPERLGRILYSFHFIGYAKPKILLGSLHLPKGCLCASPPCRTFAIVHG